MMENTDLTFSNVKQLHADKEPVLFEVEDHADELRYEIACRKAALRRLRAKRSTFVGRMIRLIRWVSQPKSKHHPQMIPGVGLELTLLCVSIAVTVGHLVFVFHA